MSATESNLTQPMQGRVDLPSHQLINDEVLISQLGRTRVREGEQFDRRFADQVMQKHLHRNRPPTTVKFLVDRMRFTKRGYHKYLPYRDVEHFYRPEEQSNAFLLFVRTTKGRHSYETYRCPNPEDVTHVKEMVDYAGYNQQKLLNSNYGSYYSSSRPESRSSIASSEYYSNDRPVSRLSRASSRSRHSEYVDVYYPSTELHPVVVYKGPSSRSLSAEPRYGYRWASSDSTPYLYQAPQPYVLQRAVTPKRQSYITTRTNSNDGSLTYLRPSGMYGTSIEDYGPVYMYSSRYDPYPNC